jgi:precorrin-6Y C5,15-methyltransferase (decarboxylating)
VSENKIHIIGMGDDGLEGVISPARQLVEQAQLLLGAESTLAKIPAGKAERLVVGSNLDEAISRIAKHGNKRIVILASGDPLFYGVARYLCDKLGKDRFEVVPHVSSMQLAFARVKESWEEAYLTNLANRTLDQVLEKIRTATKVGLFTSDEAPPRTIAKALLDRRIDYFSAYVCENLGSPDEGHAGRIVRNRHAGFLAVERHGAGPPARRAGPAQRGHRSSAVRQS